MVCELVYVIIENERHANQCMSECGIAWTITITIMTMAHGNFTPYTDQIWKLPSAIKNLTAHLPNVNITPDNVLIVGPGPFQVQEIQCLFEISGIHSPTLRVVFYTLSVISLFFAKEEWIAGVSMAYVMIYSTV